MTPQEDFQVFMREKGVDSSSLNAIRDSLPKGTPVSNGLSIEHSVIEGEGVFATQDFPKGSHLALLKDRRGWTEAGMRLNHSNNPTVHAFAQSIYAYDDIRKGDELTVNYREIGNMMGVK